MFRRKKEILQRQIRHILFDNFPRLTFSLIISLIFLLKYPFFFGTRLDLYIENKEEIIDQKVARIVAITLHFSPSLQTSIVRHFLSTYYIYYTYCKILSWKKFSKERFCDFLGNSQKCLFRKIKSRQEHCQNV